MSPSLASFPAGRFGTSNAPKKADHPAAPDELAVAHLDGPYAGSTLNEVSLR
jgi:hypothetical protein